MPTCSHLLQDPPLFAAQLSQDAAFPSSLQQTPPLHEPDVHPVLALHAFPLGAFFPHTSSTRNQVLSLQASHLPLFSKQETQPSLFSLLAQQKSFRHSPLLQKASPLQALPASTGGGTHLQSLHWLPPLPGYLRRKVPGGMIRGE